MNRKPYSYTYPGELHNQIFRPMKELSTDLDRDSFEAKDDPAFTRRFFREVSLCIGIGFIMTIGLIWVVVNADKIDNWFSQLMKYIFL